MQFGLGCFTFPMRNTSNKSIEISYSHYFDRLEDSLGRLPSVSHLSIRSEVRRDPRTFTVAPAGEANQMLYGQYPQPDLQQTDTRVDFRLHVPARVQESVPPRNRFLGAEDFTVSVRWGFYGPMAFVVPDFPKNAHYPNAATSVAMVREFLERELEDRTSEVMLDCLGPSPLHAHFSLTSAGTAAPSMALQVTKSDGYDHYEFEYNPLMHDDSEEVAFRELSSALVDEASLIYCGVLLRAQSYTDWERVESSIELLTSLERRKGLWDSLKRTLSSEPATSLLAIEIAEFEIAQIRRIQSLKSMRAEIEDGARAPWLGSFIDRHVSLGDDYPVVQATRIVEVAGVRRSHSINLLALLVSSVLGGAVGAGLTSLAT